MNKKERKEWQSFGFFFYRGFPKHCSLDFLKSLLSVVMELK